MFGRSGKRGIAVNSKEASERGASSGGEQVAIIKGSITKFVIDPLLLFSIFKNA